MAVSLQALAVMTQITASNKAENSAVKQAKSFQKFANQPANTPDYPKAARISDLKGANAAWKKAREAAWNTFHLFNKLLTYADSNGNLSTTYPLVNANTWNGYAGQNALHDGLIPAKRIDKYLNIIHENDARIKNLQFKPKLHFDFGDDGTTDTNGNVNVSISDSQTALGSTLSINPDTIGVPVPGSNPSTPTQPLEPTTGAPIEEENVGWTFNRLALGGAALAAAFYFTTRR